MHEYGFQEAADRDHLLFPKGWQFCYAEGDGRRIYSYKWKRSVIVFPGPGECSHYIDPFRKPAKFYEDT